MRKTKLNEQTGKTSEKCKNPESESAKWVQTVVKLRCGTSGSWWTVTVLNLAVRVFVLFVCLFLWNSGTYWSRLLLTRHRPMRHRRLRARVQFGRKLPPASLSSCPYVGHAEPTVPSSGGWMNNKNKKPLTRKLTQYKSNERITTSRCFFFSHLKFKANKQ